MDLLILEQDPDTYGPYRGVNRLGPPYINALGRDAEVNQVFYWYLHATSKSEGVRDLARALEIVSLYRRVAPAVHLEIIEVTTGPLALPEVGRELLGYDIAEAGGYGISLVQDCLSEWSVEEHGGKWWICDDPTAASPLDHLWSVYFRERLNEHGLLPDFATAAFCLACDQTLHSIAMVCEVFVNPTVIGLWSVPTDE